MPKIAISNYTHDIADINEAVAKWNTDIASGRYVSPEEKADNELANNHRYTLSLTNVSSEQQSEIDVINTLLPA